MAVENKIFEFSAKSISGENIPLENYRGKYILLVNTASKCGFTPQYKGLEELSKKYAEDIAVLGFPCNQFGGQEPGSEEEIASFCDLNFGVTFPLFAKVDVNGDNADPLFVYAKEQLPGLMGSKKVKWDFTKFLFGKDGTPLKRYAPTDTPEKIAKDIESGI